MAVSSRNPEFLEPGGKDGADLGAHARNAGSDPCTARPQRKERKEPTRHRVRAPLEFVAFCKPRITSVERIARGCHLGLEPPPLLWTPNASSASYGQRDRRRRGAWCVRRTRIAAAPSACAARGSAANETAE